MCYFLILIIDIYSQRAELLAASEDWPHGGGKTLAQTEAHRINITADTCRWCLAGDGGVHQARAVHVHRQVVTLGDRRQFVDPFQGQYLQSPETRLIRGCALLPRSAAVKANESMLIVITRPPHMLCVFSMMMSDVIGSWMSPIDRICSCISFRSKVPSSRFVKQFCETPAMNDGPPIATNTMFVVNSFVICLLSIFMRTLLKSECVAAISANYFTATLLAVHHNWKN